ncbi:MAG: hypothetical protein H6698_01955 [Myxococcales bacterium]|nr:hypothetical protein [Myxococcales bacterium]
MTHLRLAAFAALALGATACAESQVETSAESPETSAITAELGPAGAAAHLYEARGVTGEVLYNGPELVGGRLTIGLTTSADSTADLLAAAVEEDPTFPAAFDFQDVEDGKYWVVAFYDVDEPNDWRSPGPGDRIGITENDAFVFRAEPPNPAVSVALR